MAKSLKDTLGLGPKIELKKTDKNIEATEKAVSQIHEPDNSQIQHIPQNVVTPVIAPTIVVPEPEISEITKRVTIDIPLSLHAEIKMNTFRKGITIKEYLLDLAKKDLGV